MSAGQLSPQILLRLLPIKATTRVAAVIRPNRGADWALADLLSSTVATSHLTFLTTSSAASILQQRTAANIIPLITDGDLRNGALRQAASWAVVNDVKDVIVGDTRVESALNALTRLDAGVYDSYAGGRSTGIEMLPADVLKVHKPFTTVDEAVIDATISSKPSKLRDTEILETEITLANQLLGSEDVPVSAVLDHAQQRAGDIAFLREESDAVIRRSVLEASHWGYLVIRRSSLLEMYETGRGGRIVVIHAMCRMVMHVSGAIEPLEADDENVSRLIDTIMERDSDGILKPLSKGRTVAGMVARPATGRFAKRIIQSERRLSNRKPFYTKDHPDDLMIITREPDHESGSLFASRLRGNPACSPLAPNGTPVYWDNRFVLSAAPVTDLDHSGHPFVASEIYKAALEAPNMDATVKGLKEAELYVRQIRRSDWEKITAITNRVRDFHVPYECIRALPAIFLKESDSSATGRLVASPHLGLSARPDLYFTAVRMPRFRSLPADVDPGFCERHFNSMRSDSRSQNRRAPSRRKASSKNPL